MTEWMDALVRSSYTSLTTTTILLPFYLWQYTKGAIYLGWAKISQYLATSIKSLLCLLSSETNRLIARSSCHSIELSFTYCLFRPTSHVGRVFVVVHASFLPSTRPLLEHCECSMELPHILSCRLARVPLQTCFPYPVGITWTVRQWRVCPYVYGCTCITKEWQTK
jgi:hypothetical protein